MESEMQRNPRKCGVQGFFGALGRHLAGVNPRPSGGLTHALKLLRLGTGLTHPTGGLYIAKLAPRQANMLPDWSQVTAKMGQHEAKMVNLAP